MKLWTYGYFKYQVAYKLAIDFCNFVILKCTYNEILFFWVRQFFLYVFGNFIDVSSPQ